MATIRRAWEALRLRAGAFGAYGLVVFVLFRIGDLAMLGCRVLLGKYLPSVDFGAIDPFFSVLSIVLMPVGIVCQTGMKSLSRLLAQGDRERSAALVRDLSGLILAGTVVVAAAILIGQSYILERLHLDSRMYVVWMIALAALALWQPLLQTVMQGAQHYIAFAAVSVAPTFAMMALTWLFVGAMGLGLGGALLARVIWGGLALLVMMPWFLPFWRGARAEYRSEVRTAGGTLGPMAVYTVSIALLMGFDRLFVRNFLLGDSGGFAAVITLGQIPLWLVSPLLMVLFPMASAEAATGRDTSRLLRDAVLAGLGLTLATVIGFVFLAPIILRAWNPEFLPYARLVWPYAVAMGLQGLINTLASVDLARSEYSGIGWIAAGAVLFCGLVYWARGDITLAGMVWAGIAVRVAILGAMGLAISVRGRRKRERDP